MTIPTGWEGIFEQDEKIVWQGVPDGSVHIGARQIPKMAFGALFAGFALFWMIGAAATGGSFWMFGLLHFTIGILLALSPVFWGPYRRRHTWYTLTNKHAFIATDLPLLGRKLKSYPITGDMPLELEKTDMPTVYFAEEWKRRKNGSYRHKIGFERVPDGLKVYGLLRDLQRNKP
ncbi:aspartate carbamoyltransferase catalytic subunit [Profundibacter sp.]|uniref:aspartate carbamoyltransferase catalytic subunit n=1 Tax=Profundibacter sp. TaxID=3101071 RepID=UPI003D0DE2B7